MLEEERDRAVHLGGRDEVVVVEHQDDVPLTGLEVAVALQGVVEAQHRGRGATVQDAFFSPETKTPYTDEFDLSYQRQFWGQTAVRAAWVRKQTRQQIGTLNAERKKQLEERQQKFAAALKRMRAEQARIEAADTMDFETFRRHYVSPERMAV